MRLDVGLIASRSRAAQDSGHERPFEGLPNRPVMGNLLPQRLFPFEDCGLCGIVPSASAKAVRFAVLSSVHHVGCVTPPHVSPHQSAAASPLWFSRLQARRVACPSPATRGHLRIMPAGVHALRALSEQRRENSGHSKLARDHHTNPACHLHLDRLAELGGSPVSSTPGPSKRGEQFQCRTRSFSCMPPGVRHMTLFHARPSTLSSRCVRTRGAAGAGGGTPRGC